MLHTPLCNLLGIEYPIIQAGMGDFISGELTAAVSNAGGLGTLSRGRGSIEEFPQQLALTRELPAKGAFGATKCAGGSSTHLKHSGDESRPTRRLEGVTRACVSLTGERNTR